MEDKDTNQEEAQQEVRIDEMPVEESFNLIVGLARNAKLTYKEHMVVSKAVKTVLGALNENLD
jgi:hypothetical protein